MDKKLINITFSPLFPIKVKTAIMLLTGNFPTISPLRGEGVRNTSVN